MHDLEAAIIHDAKNRMTELALRLENRGNCADEMEILIRTSQRLTNLLLWYRQEDNQLRLNIDSTSPSDMLEDMVIEFQKLFPRLAININTQDAPAFWFYDETLTRLGLENAIHNACLHAKSNVTLSARKEGNRLVFSVHDDGKGFTENVIQQHASGHFADVSHRGTGLGLVLTTNIAKLHTAHGMTGEVTLHNQNGAVFEMFLP